MTSKIKLKDIKSKDELLTRVVDGYLSCGNQYSRVQRFLKKERTNESDVMITVSYTAGSGSHEIERFI